MNLIDENVEQADIEKKKKIITIIVATIAILIILAILIVVYTTIKSNNTLKLNINNTNKGMPDGLVLMDNKKDAHVENNNIYISVKKMAAILGVDYYNDEYKNKGEDTTKCYIKTSNEYTSFISDSSKIYKAIILDDIENEENTNNNNTVNSNTNNKKSITKIATLVAKDLYSYRNSLVHHKDRKYGKISLTEENCEDITLFLLQLLLQFYKYFQNKIKITE